jgi:peroxiredoxin
MRRSILRLAGGAVVIFIGLVVSWQAGLIGGSDGGEKVEGVELEAANTSIETASVDGRAVGLDIGDTAPDFEFSAYDGQRLKLSDLRGQPVIVNFWATWCQPCRAEMPAIDEAMRRFLANNLAVIAMNKGESYSAGSNWLKDLGLNFTAFGHDPNESVYKTYTQGLIQGLPVSYFIDANGVIVERVLGPLRVSDLDFAISKALVGAE